MSRESKTWQECKVGVQKIFVSFRSQKQLQIWAYQSRHCVMRVLQVLFEQTEFPLCMWRWYEIQSRWNQLTTWSSIETGENSWNGFLSLKLGSGRRLAPIFCFTSYWIHEVYLESNNSLPVAFDLQELTNLHSAMNQVLLWRIHSVLSGEGCSFPHASGSIYVYVGMWRSVCSIEYTRGTRSSCSNVSAELCRNKSRRSSKTGLWEQTNKCKKGPNHLLNTQKVTKIDLNFEEKYKKWLSGQMTFHDA